MKSKWERKRPARPGSLGHHLLQVLQAVFQPGTSRHAAKQRGEAEVLIFSKETMRKYTTQAFELAAFVRAHAPDCRQPEAITPALCAAFIDTLVGRELAGGRLGRYVAISYQMKRDKVRS